MATQLVDLIWPLFLLFGWETVSIEPGITVVTPLNFLSYPITHSLVSGIIWGALFGGLVFVFRRRTREALILAACVVSHWVLDFITHRPDLPILPWGDMKVGLGLWNSLTGTVILEFGIFAAGVALYAQAIHALGKRVRLSFWLFAGFLVVVHIMNLIGPPPPSVQMIAVAGNAMWLFVLWAWWSDRGFSEPVTTNTSAG